jgi:hypothetical protein
MTIMPNINEVDNSISESCEKFIKRFKINRLLRNANAAKEKGFPTSRVFAFLLGLVFTGKNFFNLLNNYPDKAPFEKDVAYRLLLKPNINWESFMFELSCSAVEAVDYLTSDERKSVLIIDDSPYYRNRSKKVEFLSRFYDHSTNKYYKGLNLMTCGWSDGQTFIPNRLRPFRFK